MSSQSVGISCSMGNEYFILLPKYTGTIGDERRRCGTWKIVRIGEALINIGTIAVDL